MMILAEQNYMQYMRLYECYNTTPYSFLPTSASMNDICVRGRESYTPHIQFMNSNMIVS